MTGGDLVVSVYRLDPGRRVNVARWWPVREQVHKGDCDRPTERRECGAASTPATTPTSTATPSASSTASTTARTVPSTTLSPFALAGAAPPTRSRRSPDLLSANEVDSSSRSNRGEKGDRGTPLKERGTTVAARSTYS
ncbi:unnamed protein product [Closterium sp. NIES-54]